MFSDIENFFWVEIRIRYKFRFGSVQFRSVQIDFCLVFFSLSRPRSDSNTSERNRLKHRNEIGSLPQTNYQWNNRNRNFSSLLSFLLKIFSRWKKNKSRCKLLFFLKNPYLLPNQKIDLNVFEKVRGKKDED